MRKLLAASLLLAATGVQATTVRQMNLDELSDRAGRIVRGVVLEATPRSVEIGGGVVQTTTYTIRVEEHFKRHSGTAGDPGIVRIEMLRRWPVAVDRVADPRLALPELEVGQTYLLIATSPGPTGLSTTVGLGQGCFRIEEVQGRELARNAVGNRGLFRGLTRESARAPEPVLTYRELATHIRKRVASRQGGRR